MFQEKFEKGEDCFKRALEISKQNFGERNVLTISIRSSFKELYIRWNKPEKADELNDESF